MSLMEELKRKQALDNAALANLPNIIERSATLLLTCRALAAALLQLDSNTSRYADLREFLDRELLERVEKSLSHLSVKLVQPVDETIEPAEWSGDRDQICSGKTQKGVACTKRATTELDGKPFCTKHFPYSSSYFESKQNYDDAWQLHTDKKTELLEQHRELLRLNDGLELIHQDLSAALKALNLKADAVPALPNRERKFETVRVDGLDLKMEVEYLGSTPLWWLAASEAGSIAVLQWDDNLKWSVVPIDNNGGYCDRQVLWNENQDVCLRFAYLFDMFYTIRPHRELSKYSAAVYELSQIEGSLTSGQALEDLCGIKKVGTGWRVFSRSLYKQWNQIHAGQSQAAAQWAYSTADKKLATMILVNPINQVVNRYCDSKQAW